MEHKNSSKSGPTMFMGTLNENCFLGDHRGRGKYNGRKTNKQKAKWDLRIKSNSFIILGLLKINLNCF